MRIQEQLRASAVKRWHIVETNAQQTLADHSFRVAMIAREIVTILFDEVHNVPDFDTMRRPYEVCCRIVAVMALDHDLEEVFRGDVPTPAKERKPYPREFTLAAVVKMADVVENYTWAQDHLIDTAHGRSVNNWLKKDFNENAYAEFDGRIFSAGMEVATAILYGQHSHGLEAGE